jgi:thiol-disulfide isomerase/thioredoxin
MWFEKILQNKTNMILIIIIILVIILYYLNNNGTNKNKNTMNTHEKFGVQNKIITDLPNNKVEFKVFYTNWCGWSKRALSTLNSDEFKNKFKEVQDKAELVLVDCEGVGKEECAKRQIQGYPTMKLFKGDKSIEFNGDRTPDGIVNFIKQNF